MWIKSIWSLPLGVSLHTYHSNSTCSRTNLIWYSKHSKSSSLLRKIILNGFEWEWMGVNGFDCARPCPGGFDSTRLHSNASQGPQTHSIVLDLARVGSAALDCTRMRSAASKPTRVCSTSPGWVRQHSIALKCVSKPSSSLGCGWSFEWALNAFIMPKNKTKTECNKIWAST